MSKFYCLNIAFVLALSFNTAYAARRDTPSILFESNYGERLESSTPDVALWWASSGWKVSGTGLFRKSPENASGLNSRETSGKRRNWWSGPSARLQALRLPPGP